MGFNTAAIILNDRLHDIARDERIGERIQSSVLTRRRRHSEAVGMDFLPSEHADTAQVVVIAANSIRALGYGHWQDDDLALIRKLADAAGYTLRRKPARSEERRAGE